MADDTKSASVAEVASDVRDLLEYAATLGFQEVTAESAPKAQARAKSKMAPEDKGRALEKLRDRMGDCNLCKLHKGRTKLVFGTGNPKAEIMFIGEGPGRDEDAQGIPFVGRAGQLLTKIIEAMGYSRDEVYIANIVKCRPPDNRNPEPDEVESCIDFLIEQVEIIQPKVIVCLGSVAVRNLLGQELKITKVRGNFLDWRGTPVMPTYHPAFLLRNPNMKKPLWEDMKKVMKFLGK